MRLADGTETTAHTWSWRGGRCPIDDGALYAPLMASVDRHARIGDADVTLYKLSEGYEVIARPLREGMAGHPPCSRCTVRPRGVPLDSGRLGRNPTRWMEKAPGIPGAFLCDLSMLEWAGVVASSVPTT